jgi:hypothetical protein
MQSLKALKTDGFQTVVDKLCLKTSNFGKLWILNYDQIDSPKKHPVADECRGLVVDTDCNLVARSFTRFYNLGEKSEQEMQFDWSTCFATEKVDGSLLVIYFYEGQWRVNTRGSFGLQEICPGVNLTWYDVVSSVVNLNGLNPEYTYVGELCSRYNKVVVDYPVPTVFILSAFKGETEVSFDEAVELTEGLGFEVPAVNIFPSAEGVLDYIKTQAAIYGANWEGVVLRDKDNRRIKVKNELYVAIHHIKDNGNIFNPKRIVPFIVAGEEAEVLAYIPELTETVAKYKLMIEKARKKLDDFWFCHHDEANQKRFALAAMKDLGNLSSVAFTARKLNKNPLDCFGVEEILKLLFKD